VLYANTRQCESTAAGLSGNFTEVAAMLVKRLSSAPAGDAKMSYLMGAHRFDYAVEGPAGARWVYLAISDESYQRMLSFKFLQEISEFVKGKRGRTAR
jgi:hypothetical protein